MGGLSAMLLKALESNKVGYSQWDHCRVHRSNPHVRPPSKPMDLGKFMIRRHDSSRENIGER